MILTIDLSADRPLYLQIVDAVRRALLDGSLLPGERLPAGRELAATLDVNLETVQRAYRQLADLGIVTSRVGRGTRVVEGLDVAALGLSDLVDELVQTGSRLGVAPGAILALVEARLAQS